jgi:hypothetical protein
MIRCHLCPILPPALSLSSTYIWRVLSKLSLDIRPIQTSYVPCAKSYIHISSLRSFTQRIRYVLGSFRIVVRMLFLAVRIFRPHAQP